MWPTDGTWVPVTSTNVAAVSYEADFRRLRVKFLSGMVYQYDGVNAGVWKGFQAGGSKGRFVWNVLRAGGTDAVYSYRRIA